LLKYTFLNNNSDTMLEVSFRPNSTLQNRLVRWYLYLIYILWNYLIFNWHGISNKIVFSFILSL